jgi:hypothetical protein
MRFNVASAPDINIHPLYRTRRGNNVYARGICVYGKGGEECGAYLRTLQTRVVLPSIEASPSRKDSLTSVIT